MLPHALAGTNVWQLVRDLLDRGQRVSVVTLDQAVTTPVAVNRQLLDVVCGPLRARHCMRDLMQVERHAVRDGLLRTRPDLVHAHWCYEYALGALATGIPTLVTVHDWAPTIVRLMAPRDRPYWMGRALMFFLTLARARYLTANSPYIADKVRRFSKAAIEVVPNGFPDASFAQEGEHAGLSAVAEQPVIISINNGFGPLKNVQSLLEAFHTLRQRGIDCQLHLVGGDYEPGGSCEAWARQRRFATGVTFVGTLPREQTLQRMARATVLVHPAREESFGMTLIEAMSQRLAVIGGTRSGAVPWVLGGGKAGLLVDVEDPRALAQAMEAVLTQPALRERLTSDGYAHAWQNFRQSSVTDLCLDAYGRLLAEEASK
jgi:glycosyltransferase involved in cell wall biosynthesis